VIDDRSTDATPEILTAFPHRGTRIQARVRWRAVRSRAYPWWCVRFVLRLLLALALPRAWRPGLRRAAGMGGSPHRV